MGVKGGRSGTCWGSSPAWLFWSSADLVQYEPDEPCWTWTQIWRLARMPDYSFNWTKGSSAIQCLYMTSSPTWRWTNRNQEPFGRESVLNLETQCRAEAQPLTRRIRWIHLGWGIPPPLTSVLDMALNNLMVRLQSLSLGNVAYPFIVITPKSTVTRSGSTWYGPLCKSNRTAWPFNCVQLMLNC